MRAELRKDFQNVAKVIVEFSRDDVEAEYNIIFGLGSVWMKLLHLYQFHLYQYKDRPIFSNPLLGVSNQTKGNRYAHFIARSIFYAFNFAPSSLYYRITVEQITSSFGSRPLAITVVLLAACGNGTLLAGKAWQAFYAQASPGPTSGRRLARKLINDVACDSWSFCCFFPSLYSH